jgi:hypothetical protein
MGAREKQFVLHHIRRGNSIVPFHAVLEHTDLDRRSLRYYCEKFTKEGRLQKRWIDEFRGDIFHTPQAGLLVEYTPVEA